MGAPAKFLFDIDFAAPEPVKETAQDRAATAAKIAQQIAEAEARSRERASMRMQDGEA